MPRQNSTSWVPNDPITAARLEDFNQDIDDLYVNGSDHLKVYRLTGDPALQVTIWAGTYRIGWAEGQYTWWTLTVSSNVTTYIMIDSAGVIQTSTSGWNGSHARLASVVSGVSTITSITDWRNKVVGWDFWWNPTGAILMWSTISAPSWYLLCDGTAVSRTTYAGLFALIGTTYWVGNGSTTFNLPNLKWRVPVGRDVWQTEFDTIGETWGAKTHTLTVSEIPQHTHTLPAAWWSSWGNGNSFAQAGNDSNGQNFTTSGWSWGWQAHNNLQPYFVLNFIIKT